MTVSLSPNTDISLPLPIKRAWQPGTEANAARNLPMNPHWDLGRRHTHIRATSGYSVPTTPSTHFIFIGAFGMWIIDTLKDKTNSLPSSAFRSSSHPSCLPISGSRLHRCIIVQPILLPLSSAFPHVNPSAVLPSAEGSLRDVCS